MYPTCSFVLSIFFNDTTGVKFNQPSGSSANEGIDKHKSLNTHRYTMKAQILSKYTQVTTLSRPVGRSSLPTNRVELTRRKLRRHFRIAMDQRGGDRCILKKGCKIARACHRMGSNKRGAEGSFMHRTRATRPQPFSDCPHQFQIISLRPFSLSLSLSLSLRIFFFLYALLWCISFVCHTVGTVFTPIESRTNRPSNRAIIPGSVSFVAGLGVSRTIIEPDDRSIGA